MALYESYEIMGTEQPIYQEKPADNYLYEEILLMDEKPGDYQTNGYLQVFVGEKPMFQPLYKKG